MATTDMENLLRLLNDQKTIEAGAPEHRAMTARAFEVRKPLLKLNCEFHTQEEIVELFSEVIGKPVDPSFGLFPPFHTEFGLGIEVGRNVFINSGCKFQDHAGIVLEDNVLIGHNVVIATLNHVQEPSRRGSLIPGKVRIRENVWVGAGAVICPGVTIGKDSIVAAGAVVTKDVSDGVIVGGVPAKYIKDIDGD